MNWYKSWFNSDYLSVYSHRDEDEARAHIQSLSKLLGSINGKTVLDIACGAGRYTRAMIAEGADTYSLDLSNDLLHAASEQTPESDTKVRLKRIRGDMRYLPFPHDCFDIALSLFTSFGYFETDSDHLDLLREWGRVLKDSGTLVLDYPNRSVLEKNLVKETVREAGTYRVLERRTFNTDLTRLEKEVILIPLEGGPERRYIESLRLFYPQEILSLFEHAGFSDLQSYASFSGLPFTPEAERILICASKKAL